MSTPARKSHSPKSASTRPASTSPSPSSSSALKRMRDTAFTTSSGKEGKSTKMGGESARPEKRARTSSSSLSERLLSLTTPAPSASLPDPEDTAWEGAVTYDTSALSDITTVGETSRIAAAPKRETLRTQQQRLETLDAVSVRYKGTRTTRQALRSDDELRKPPLKSKKRNHKEKDSDDEEEEESDSMELDQDGEEEEDVESEDEMMDDDEDDEDDQDDEEFDGDFDGDEEEQDMMDEVDSDDLDEDDEEGDEGKENSESGSEEGAGAARVALTRAVAARSVAATVARARRTQEQHALYEAALQLRLALQQPLALSRQLPAPLAPSPAATALQSTLSDLLSDLTQLQAALPLPESRTDIAPTRTLASALQETQQENGARNNGSGAPRNSDAWWEQLSARAPLVDAAVRGAVDAWHAQTSGVGALKALNASPVAQSEAMLSHEATRAKLLSRALGTEGHYDDEELFHALLKELVLSGTAAADAALSDDPIAMSQAYLRLRRLRTRKQRKDVDRRASKGRKLRFQPHEKLAVFMAPVPNAYPQRDMTRTEELFKSLFGAKPKTE